MSDKVNPVPRGYHTVTPYLIVDDAGKAIAFYEEAFGAKEVMRMEGPDGSIAHAEVMIGDSHVMLADEHPEIGAKGPGQFGGSPVMMHLYLDGVDEVVNRALAAGAELVRPVEDQFYGNRSGMVKDPFGHSWNVATQTEELGPEEMKRRAEAMARKKTQG